MGEEEPSHAQLALKHSTQLQTPGRAGGYVIGLLHQGHELVWEVNAFVYFRGKDKNPDILEEAEERSLLVCVHAHKNDKKIKRLLLHKEPNPTCLLEKD